MNYRRIVKLAVFLGLVAVASGLPAERQPYERYQSVVDRQMFGAPPAGFDPTKSPSEVSAKEARAQEQELSKEQEQIKSSIHFSMINVTPSGETAVGFTDNSDSKNPCNYYLKVGETRNGWTVKEADPLKSTMTVVKGDVEVSLELGGNSSSGGGSVGSTKGGGGSTARRGSAFPSRPSLLGGRTTSTDGSTMGRSLGSLRERRALRDQQRAADAQAAAEREKLAAEKEAQREEERRAERAQREQEREEQRAQLLQIQEELRKAREARANAQEEKPQDGESGKAGD